VRVLAEAGVVAGAGCEREGNEDVLKQRNWESIINWGISGKIILEFSIATFDYWRVPSDWSNKMRISICKMVAFDFVRTHFDIPSGNSTVCYGTSQSLRNKIIALNEPFSIYVSLLEGIRLPIDRDYPIIFFTGWTS
jgi:hypothetical protein